MCEDLQLSRSGGGMTPSQKACVDLRAMPVADAVADVCAYCGQHIIMDPIKRLAWLREGGTLRCHGIERSR